MSSLGKMMFWIFAVGLGVSLGMAVLYGWMFVVFAVAYAALASWVWRRENADEPA